MLSKIARSYIDLLQRWLFLSSSKSISSEKAIFDNISICTKYIHSDNILGDYVDVKSSNSRIAIFMRGILNAYESERKVWVISNNSEIVNEFTVNFSKYNLLENVHFLTDLDITRINKIALLRIVSTSYDITLDVLLNMYYKLTPGGYCVINDFMRSEDCAKAVREFRMALEITDSFAPIDAAGIYWRKSQLFLPETNNWIVVRIKYLCGNT